MPAINMIFNFWQVIFAFCFAVFFIICGNLLIWVSRVKMPNEKVSGYFKDFYGLVAGMVIVTGSYAIIGSSFKTVFTLLVPVFAWLVISNRKINRKAFSIREMMPARILEIFILALLFVSLFHLLPESEYKQNDSFFYLKMSEALRLTGQENLHHYYNLYDPAYHGLEPYHYFELWLNAFLLSFTGNLLPDIQVFRFILYSVIGIATVFGFYHLSEVVTKRKPGFAVKLFCLSFIFFMPDLFPYNAMLRHFAIYSFENNIMERPNFRVIYLLLLPVILSLVEEKPGKMFFVFTLILLVSSYTAFLVFLPAIFLFAIVQVYLKKQNFAIYYSPTALLFFSIITGFSFLLFYWLFRNRDIASFYDVSLQYMINFAGDYSRFLFISLTTSFLYVILLLIIYTGWFFITRKTEWKVYIINHIQLLACLICIIISGLFFSRLLYFIDNAYQFAHISYIVVSCLIFITFLYFSASYRKPWFYLISTGIFCIGFLMFKYVTRNEIFVNIYAQNGKACYAGKPYSQRYLKQVSDYLSGKKDMLGGYIADSSFYKDLYYSRRNPNVYAMPVTYIIADQVRSNFEFCLSDTASIKYKAPTDVSSTSYLENAIRRSFYYRYCNLHKDQPEVDRMTKFIKIFKLKYIIVSPGLSSFNYFKNVSDSSFTDGNTGEQFVVLHE